VLLLVPVEISHSDLNFGPTIVTLSPDSLLRLKKKSVMSCTVNFSPLVLLSVVELILLLSSNFSSQSFLHLMNFDFHF
jgi:hypothetical protein